VKYVARAAIAPALVDEAVAIAPIAVAGRAAVAAATRAAGAGAGAEGRVPAAARPRPRFPPFPDPSRAAPPEPEPVARRRYLGNCGNCISRLFCQDEEKDMGAAWLAPSLATCSLLSIAT